MKTTREIATEYRMSHWSEIMHLRTESGLSIKSYCKREGIHPNVYFYWQRKLREAAMKELLPVTPTPSASNAPVQVLPEVPPQVWAEVTSADKDMPPSADGLTIEIGKSRITVNASMDSELLTKVCKVLVELC